MDFFLDLFDSDKKNRKKEESKLKASPGKGASCPDLPPLRRDKGQLLKKYDPREATRVKDDRMRRELQRLYLWDGKFRVHRNHLSGRPGPYICIHTAPHIS